MLVKEANGKRKAVTQAEEDGSLKAVTAIDKKGNLKTTDPDEGNMAKLLNVNTNDSFLEAFYKKFLEQADNPAHTGIFIMTQSALEKLIKMDFDPNELEKHRVNPEQELQNLQAKGETKEQQQTSGQTKEQSFQPMDVNKIDRADLERKGIAWEAMEPHLKAMSYGHKSGALVEMNPQMEPGGLRVPTKGRISLEEQPDGSIKAIPHYHQEKPPLNAPLHGVLLDDEAKENLLATNNAGKVIELELTPGKKEPCYVTLDKMTNGLEVLPVSQIGPVEKLKGVELTQGQQLDFAAGRKVLVEGMTSRSGAKFDGYVQVNASDKKFDFTYEGLDRNRYAKENKEIRRQRKAEGKEPKKEVSGSEAKNQLTIHKRMLGADVPQKAYDEWKAAEKDPSLRASTKAHYIKGMTDAKGEPFNAWVKPNWELGKPQFFKWNPDYAKKQGAEVKPATESKTQVAVNSEGKTNEATKKVNEPLKQGQQKPTDTQQKKQEENKQRQNPVRKPSAPKKGRGVS